MILRKEKNEKKINSYTCYSNDRDKFNNNLCNEKGKIY